MTLRELLQEGTELTALGGTLDRMVYLQLPGIGCFPVSSIALGKTVDYARDRNPQNVSANVVMVSTRPQDVQRIRRELRRRVLEAFISQVDVDDLANIAARDYAEGEKDE